MRTDTSYLGFRLPHPFIAGVSPYGHHLDMVKRVFYWGVEIRTPPWNANSFPPPIVH